jgi:dolichol-phosphate mannosyltransferase
VKATHAPEATVVVVPTLNEAANIAELIARVTEAAPDAHIWIVDDQSSDGTADVAQEAFGGRPGCRVLSRSGPRGLGRAYAEAFQAALADGYGAVVQMDADLSHDPAALPSLRAALSEADLVIGSRYCSGGGIEGWAIHRVLLSRFANRYACAVTGLGINDITAGYRAWRASALRSVQLETVASAGYSIQVELAVRAHCAGLRIREVPIVFTDRRRGQSKMNLHVLAESVLMPWRLRAYIAQKKKEGPWRQSL